MKHLVFALILATLAWNFFAPDASLPGVGTAAATGAEKSDGSTAVLPAP